MIRVAAFTALLLLNAGAGACSITAPPVNPDFQRWERLLQQSRGQIARPTVNGTARAAPHVNSDIDTLSPFPKLTDVGVKQFEACPANIADQFRSVRLPLVACETVRRPFAEVKAAGLKAYARNLISKANDTLKFAGAGGSWALGGEFWNGTQLTFLPQRGKTVLVWQAVEKEVVADRLNRYMDERLSTFFQSHRKFFESASRPRMQCSAFGIVDQDFFKFKECYAMEQPAGTMPHLLIRFVLAASADESMPLNVPYIRVDGGTCGSEFRVF